MAKITIERQGQRVYLVGDTFVAKDRIKAMGGHWNGERRAWWVGAAKLAEAEKLVAELESLPAPKTGPGDDSRVKAKVRYKGRTYYVLAESADRCRLTVLDGSIDFWADKSACELLKTYAPREYRGRQEYTTLGSLRRFVERQRRAEASGEPVCSECGIAGGELVADLEDGALKHRRCCDIEP